MVLPDQNWYPAATDASVSARRLSRLARSPLLDQPPRPNIIAREIVDDLGAALEQFREIAEDLEGKNATTS